MRRAILLSLLLFFAPAALADDDGFKIIVNDANPASTLPRAEVAAFFLKKVTVWPTGATVAPIDRASGDVREKFSASVLSKSVPAVKAYWQQRIFSGKDIPPPTRATDAEVVAFVRENPNAIGYVSSKESTAGVKVVRLSE